MNPITYLKEHLRDHLIKRFSDDPDFEEYDLFARYPGLEEFTGTINLFLK